MSTIPSDPAGASPFTPNPDIDLDLHAAAAAYEVDMQMNRLVDDILTLDAPLTDLLFGSATKSMSKSEFVRGVHAWKASKGAKDTDDDGNSGH